MTRTAFPVFGLLLLSIAFLSPPVFSQAAEGKPTLATLTAVPDKIAFELGEEIHVTLTLRAGRNGAYVARWSTCAGVAEDFWCGRSMHDSPGFDFSVLTLAGKNASSIGHGGAADPSTPLPSPKEVFEKDYVFLTRATLSVGRVCAGSTPSRPGVYVISGHYSPSELQLTEIAKLPETRGLLIASPIEAPRVFILVVK